MDVLDDYVEHVLSFIDPTIIKPFNVVLDAGSGMGGLVAPEAVRAPALQDHAALLRHRRHVSRITKPTRSSRKTAATSSSASSATRPTSASPGTAMRIAASSSTAAGEFIAGDFVTALLAEAFLLKHAGRQDRLRRSRQLRGQGHRREVRRHGADESRRPRVLQEAHARGRRRSSAARSPGTTTSATISTPTTGSSRRC